MLKIKYTTLILIIFLISACGKVAIVRNYYLLDYNPILEDAELALDEPLEYSVQVFDASMPRTYDRSQIVIRYSSHKVNFQKNDIWAVRLSYAIPDLMQNHISAYNLFTRCQREFLEDRPDYEVVIHVNQIEKYQSEFYEAAHLGMSISLRKSDDRDFVVQHVFNQEVELKNNKTELFAKAISDMIKKETDLFLVKAVKYFKSLEAENDELDNFEE